MKRLSKSQIVGELGLARESFGKGDGVSALRRLDAVLRSNPDSFEAHFGRATLLMAVDRPEEALLGFKQVLRYEPNSRDALLWVAKTAISLGRSPEAESYLVRLIKFDPNNDQAQYLLSVVQSMSGNWLDAVEAVDRALKVKPNDLNYLIGKAQLLTKLHVYSLAISLYRKALSIDQAPQIAKELAEVLLEEGQADEALSLLEKFVGDFPADLAIQTLLARANAEAGKPVEAEKYWLNAKSLTTDQGGYVSSRARHEIAMGQIEQAEVLLREGLSLKPSDIQTFALLAPIITFGSGEAELIGGMEREIESGSHPTQSRQTLAFALGKAFNDLGDYERAMFYFDLANRLRVELTPDGLRFDPEGMAMWVDFQIRSFTPERITALEKEGLDSDLPLFVVGMIRSGTTLTEQILSCHSQISAGGEVSYWVDHSYEIADSMVKQNDPAKARRLGKEYLRTLQGSARGRPHVVDKNPLNVLLTPTLHCLFPRARFIHLKRNAVDNMLSIWMTPLTTGYQFITTREELVSAYKQYLRLADHMEQVLPAENFRTFPYEDLTSNPDSSIESMVRYLGLGMEEACLYPERNPRIVKTPSMYQVRKPINTESQDRWKRYEPWLGPFAELIGS